MPLYRRLPGNPIEARQWPGLKGQVREDWPGVEYDPVHGVYVTTIHGQRAYLAAGDWILPEPDGVHFYPCKPEIFAATYEAVTSPPALVEALGDALLAGQGATLTRVSPTEIYPGPMNGDRAEFEVEWAASGRPQEERPDWPLPSFDARDWAKAFCDIALKLGICGPERARIDEGWMVTWFANALMRGYDEGRAKTEDIMGDG